MSSTNQQPSLVSGHAQFVKGAAEQAIGSVTGDESWKSSGATDKDAGVKEMKAAGEQRQQGAGYGRAEELAGKAVGCEGMEKEGQQSQQ